MTEQPKKDCIFKIPENTITFHAPKQSNYKCYLFGNRPDVNTGIVYIPAEGRVPNCFVRFMMRICFDSVWVKEND
jgi:hypothetical protein